MVWKFVWGYWGKAYGWFYGLGSGKDGRKENWSMNTWMAQEWQAERGNQCVAFKKCMRKSSGKKDQREGELLNVTWKRIARWWNRWDNRKVYERWTLMMISCDNVRRCDWRESVKLCLNICTWSDRLEWDLETKSTSMLVLPHHCHPHPSREGMTNPDDAMSWWKHSTAEWKGTCFMECEGE